MTVRSKVDDLGYAILLKVVSSHDDAIYVRDCLIATGLNPVISAVCEDGYHVLLHGVSGEAFADAIAAAHVKLI